jgi:hypothetical protein
MARQTAGPPQWLNSKGSLPLDIAYRQDALRVFRPPTRRFGRAVIPTGRSPFHRTGAAHRQLGVILSGETVGFVDS